MIEFFEKPADNSIKPVDNSVKPAEFRVFKFFSVPFVTQLHFGQNFPVFTDFLKIWQIHHLPIFKKPPNFETLGPGSILCKPNIFRAWTAPIKYYR
jgi:hypothetical protein